MFQKHNDMKMYSVFGGPGPAENCKFCAAAEPVAQFIKKICCPTRRRSRKCRPHEPNILAGTTQYPQSARFLLVA